MKHLHIFKAQDIGPNARVESLTIVMDEWLPDQSSFEELRHLYEDQADQLAQALHNTLPGGVYDRLLANMFLKKASLLGRPFGRLEE